MSEGIDTTRNPVLRVHLFALQLSNLLIQCAYIEVDASSDSIVKVMVKTVQVQTTVVIFIGLATLAIACAANVNGFEYILLI